MRLNVTVKILQGPECYVELPASATIADVKAQVCEQMKVPVADQKLVFKGKTLTDDRILEEIGVTDGGRLFLVVKKTDDASSRLSSQSRVKPSTAPRVDLWLELRRFLEKHYREADARRILEEFQKEFYQTLDNMSLDDIERLAKANLELMQS